MAVITRITDFIPNTLIESQEVDDEFNQLVNLLSGVSTDKDTLLKYSHAADPVLRVDQLGAGIIQRWLQNGGEKARVNNDGSFNIGAPGAAPVAGLVGGPDASGTNTAGVNLNLAGGKGTGNAAPGNFAVRYPLIGASGSALQSLSTIACPVQTNLYLNYSTTTTVANTTTETSLMGAADFGTDTIEAGLGRVGRAFRLNFCGTLATSGAGTLTVRLKLGGTTIQTWSASITAGSTDWRLETFVSITAIGAGGSVRVPPIAFAYSSTSPAPVNWISVGQADTGIDFTAAQQWSLTAQWGAADAGDTFTYNFGMIDIVR